MKAATLATILVLGALGCGGATFNAPDGGPGDGGNGSSSGSGSGGSSGGSTSGGGSGSSSGGSSGGGSGGSSSGGGSGSSSGGSSGGVGSSSSSGGGTVGCPLSPPAMNSPCIAPNAGLTCEWGMSVDPSCNEVATCTNGVWSFRDQPPGACMPGPPIMCPSSYGSVPVNTPCSPMGAFCDYPQGRCACTLLGGPAMEWDGGPVQGEWICGNPGGGCPSPRPLLGTPCTQEGHTCDYGVCDIPGGTAEQCSGGIWVTAAVGCPVSAQRP